MTQPTQKPHGLYDSFASLLRDSEMVNQGGKLALSVSNEAMALLKATNFLNPGMGSKIKADLDSFLEGLRLDNSDWDLLSHAGRIGRLQELNEYIQSCVKDYDRAQQVNDAVATPIQKAVQEAVTKLTTPEPQKTRVQPTTEAEQISKRTLLNEIRTRIETRHVDIRDTKGRFLIARVNTTLNSINIVTPAKDAYDSFIIASNAAQALAEGNPGESYMVVQNHGTVTYE